MPSLSPRNAVLLAAAWTGAFFLLETQLRADRVELKAGEVFDGKVLRLTKDQVSIRLQTGAILTFRMDAVSTVKQSEPGKDSPHEDFDFEDEIATPPPPVKGKDDPPSQDPAPVGPDGAQKKPGPQPPVPTPGVLPGTGLARRIATDMERGIAVAPPEGFVALPKEKCEGKVFAWEDPTISATFSVATQRTTETVQESKRRLVETSAKQLASFHVVRNEVLKKGDAPVRPEAWIVEAEMQADGGEMRQIQVFTKRKDELFTLTYVLKHDAREGLRRSIDESIDSFRFLETPPPRR